MKRIIASALAILLGSLGFVVVDNTIENRVATLESQLASLSAEKENVSDKDVHKIGDKIPCFPESPYSFDSVIGYSDNITVCIDSFTAEIIAKDEVNTNGETLTQSLLGLNAATEYTFATSEDRSNAKPSFDSTETTKEKLPTIKSGEYNVYSCYKFGVEIRISGKIQNIDNFSATKIKISYTINDITYSQETAINSNGSFALVFTRSFSNIPEGFEISSIDIVGVAR